jgi:methanethiol S-methyltransferase
MTKRIIIFLYGSTSYALFFATYLYAIGFIGNFGVVKTLDSAVSVAWPDALSIDLGLLALFAFQHSVMARPGFKRILTRIVPVTIERSTYVLASSAALLFLFWKWSPIGGLIWNTEGSLRACLIAGCAFGWLLVLIATFAINHFDLFGLRQVWRHLVGKPQTKLEFVTPIFYRLVRHPLYVGWMFAFWSTPTMTITHLVFALSTTAYILLAIRWEERDLMREHPEYSAYREQVPMLIPRWRKRPSRLAASIPVASGEPGKCSGH